MTRGQKLILGLCLVLSVGGRGAMPSAATPENVEACAGALFEKAMTTPRRINRRAFTAGLWGLAAGGIYWGYHVASFRPNVWVVTQPKDLRTLLSRSPKARLAVSVFVNDDATPRDVQIQYFQQMGLGHVIRDHRLPVDGMLPPYADVSLYFREVAEFYLALGNVAKGGTLNNFGRFAAISPETKRVLAAAVRRISQPDYFARVFPNAAAANEAAKLCPRFVPFLDPNSMSVHLQIKIKPDGGRVIDASGARLQADALNQLEASDDAAFRLFLAALAREWAAELKRIGVRDPLALSSENAVDILENGKLTEKGGRSLELLYDEETKSFGRQFLIVYERARSEGVDLIVYAPEWFTADLEEAIPAGIPWQRPPTAQKP